MPLGVCDTGSRSRNNTSATVDMQNYRTDNQDGCNCRNPGPNGKRTPRCMYESDRWSRLRGYWMESLQIDFELLVGSLHRNSPWRTWSRAAWPGRTGIAKQPGSSVHPAA